MSDENFPSVLYVVKKFDEGYEDIQFIAHQRFEEFQVIDKVRTVAIYKLERVAKVINKTEIV